jgi:hypothetical protein
MSFLKVRYTTRNQGRGTGARELKESSAAETSNNPELSKPPTCPIPTPEKSRLPADGTTEPARLPAGGTAEPPTLPAGGTKEPARLPAAGTTAAMDPAPDPPTPEKSTPAPDPPTPEKSTPAPDPPTPEKSTPAKGTKLGPAKSRFPTKLRPLTPPPMLDAILLPAALPATLAGLELESPGLELEPPGLATVGTVTVGTVTAGIVEAVPGGELDDAEAPGREPPG